MTFPAYRKVIPENIPVELKEQKIWVAWQPKKKKGNKKPGKLPVSYQINEATGEKEVKAASCDNPETWMFFDEALALLKSAQKYKGLCIALSSGPLEKDTSRLIGVDLDHAFLLDGSIKPDKKDDLKLFNDTYAELSPTEGLDGGLRIFCYGCFSEGEEVHKGDFEIYQYGKFLSITGHKLKDVPDTIESAQEAIDTFRAKHFIPFPEIDETSLPVTHIKYSDEQLLFQLNNYKLSDQFKELYYKGVTEGEDHSIKDLDFCRLLVFWTQDQDQIDRIFRQSKLLRKKWDEIHGHDDKSPLTYGQKTINYALKTRTKVYNPTNRKEPSQQSEFSFSSALYKVTDYCIYKKDLRNYDEETNEHKEKPISKSPCIITAIGENIDTGDILYKLKFRDIRHREKNVWKTTGDLMKKSEIIKLLDDGMHFKESHANDLIDFFDNYIGYKSDELPSEIAASIGGWKNDFSLFVVGGRAISVNGVIEVLQLDNPTAKMFTEKGSIKEWARGANIILPYPAVRYKMYSAFVPPLLRLLYITPYVVDNYGPTGQLKSVSNWLAASMWGEPISQQAGGNSTTVGILKLIEYCKDIPTFLDETSQNPEVSRKLVYAVANSSSRLKGTTDGKNGLVMPDATSTVLIATGEDPIISENAHGGEDVRSVPLPEGVTDLLPTEEVAEMEILLKNNYGHIAVRFIQELFKEKDNLRTIYKAFLEHFPAVAGISSNRAKKVYAATATAGFILEKVFADIGINPMDPFDVCNRYFEKNILDNAFIPDHIKALTAAYSMFSTNEAHFGEEDETEYNPEDKTANLEKYGWIREDSITHDKLICFNETALQKHINAILGPNRYESAVTRWKELNILNIRKITDKITGRIKVLKTVQIKVHGRNTSVLQIPLKNFYRYLNLVEHDKGTEGNTEDINQPPGPKTPTLQTALPMSNVGIKVVTSIDALEAIASGIKPLNENTKTRVVNRHKEKFDIYIGRSTIYGNPYIIGTDGTREEVIEKYKIYYWNKPELINATLSLNGKVLGCSCKPNACHGDYLVELTDALANGIIINNPFQYRNTLSLYEPIQKPTITPAAETNNIILVNNDTELAEILKQEGLL